MPGDLSLLPHPENGDSRPIKGGEGGGRHADLPERPPPANAKTGLGGGQKWETANKTAQKHPFQNQAEAAAEEEIGQATDHKS